MKSKQRQERGIDTHKMAASRRFGKYKKEETQENREVEIRKDPVFEQLLDKFKKLLVYSGQGCVSEEYGSYVSDLKGIDYPPRDVEKFCFFLPHFKNMTNFNYVAGLFMSALINKGRHRDYHLITSDMPGIQRLGYSNTKNITVEGPGGEMLGLNMTKGTIEVNGPAWFISYLKGGRIIVDNAPMSVGEGMEGGEIIVNKDASSVGPGMSGGRIVIAGNADGEVGWGMKNGKIHIHGNASHAIGRKMTGGEIHVDGEINSIEDVLHGKIYHKGKLIVDK